MIPTPRVLARLAISLWIATTGCTAPASVPARGAVGDAVEASIAGGTGRFDHSGWGRLLAEGTREGLVDYGYFDSQRRELDAYLEGIATADLASLTGSDLEALLMNAYNALTIRSILDHPGVTSIRDIDGVWTETRHRVGGFELTLDEIEHNLLRPFWKDPRIHFAVNCASLSCAPLPTWAFDGDALDEQLEERATSFLTDPANVRFEDGKLHLSKYFDWYGADFTAPGWAPRADSIPIFVANYATPEVADAIAAAEDAPPVAFLAYDWALNSATP